MYARTVDDQLLTFGVSGKLIMNVLVMFDHETDTLWSQLLGEAVSGPLLGAKLQPIASIQTTWQQWKTLHPDTKALVTNGMGRYDSYSSYYESSRTGVIGETRQDERVPGKELVTGVVVDGQPAAYPHTTLAVERVVNDTVNGVPLLVVFDPPTETALVFLRTIAEGELTFVEDPTDAMVFVDQESGTRWQMLTGAAFEGSLSGSVLERLPSTSSFWFGWKDFYPQTLVYGR